MAKHVDWRRVRGGASDAEARSLGDKLLGYLADIRRLSGVKTQTITRTMDDGTVVRARWLGDQPVVDITPGPPGKGKIEGTMLSGFVTRPRQEDDQDYFGDKAHQIVRPKTDGYGVGYFDASYVPADTTAATYSAPFPEGLKHFGITDWRNQDQTVCVTWSGGIERSLQPRPNTDTFIFHNGEVLLDHATIVGRTSDRILGACVQEAVGASWLYWVSTPFSDPVTLRLWRAPVLPKDSADRLKELELPSTRAPRWAVIDPDAVEVLQDIPLENAFADFTTLFNRIGVFAFNQSATEGRVIYECYSDVDQREMRYTELVVDLAENTATHTLRAVLTTTTTKEYTYSTVRAALKKVRTKAIDPLWDPFAAPGDSSATFTEDETVISMQGSPETNVLLLEGSATMDVSPSVTDIPIFVDYQDDVPVYLYWTPLSMTGTCTRNATFSYSQPTLSQSFDWHYVSSGDPANTAHAQYDEEEQTDSSLDIVTSTTVTGGRLYAVDKDTVTWWSFDYAGGTEASLTAATTETLTQHSTDDLVGYSGGSNIFDYALDTSGTYSASRTGTAVSTYTSLDLWHLDLRYRIAVVTERTVTGTGDSSASVTGTNSYSATVSGVPGGTSLGHVSVPLDIDATYHGENTLTRQYVTKVYMDGVLVDSATATIDVPIADTDLTDTTVLESAWPLRAQDPYGGMTESPVYAPDDITPGTQVNGGWVNSFSTEVSDIWDAAIAATNPADTTMDTVTVVTTDVATSHEPDELPMSLRVASPWMGSLPTQDGVAVDVNQSVRLGTWIVYRGYWAFSMAWLEGTDITLPSWHSALEGATIHDVLINHLDMAPDLYETMWPLSDSLMP